MTGKLCYYLSAAFDTVDHTILINRMKNHFGLSDKVLDWFSSYLQDRKQRVTIKGTKSNPTNLDCCVPQGAILGADLYSYYTTPLGNLLRLLLLLYHMYADDTQLLKILDPNIPNTTSSTSGRTTGYISETSKWMQANKLKLNEDKTEFLVIGRKEQLKKVNIDSITVGADKILKSSSARNLGVTVDENMNLEKHILNLTRACYLQLRNIYKIKKYLTIDARKSLIQATVTSRLDYCNSLLSGLPDKLIKKSEHIQNACARLITNTPKYHHITPVLKHLHWHTGLNIKCVSMFSRHFMIWLQST